MNSNFFNLRGMHMRIDLSREEETKMLPPESLGLVSMNAFQNKLDERTGNRVKPKTYESFKEFFELKQFSAKTKTHEKAETSDEFGPNEVRLKDRLINFEKKVIRKECPNTPEDYRLMRPEMLEILLKRQPINCLEFSKKIPGYLRLPMQTNHSNPQSKYIKDVVKIIDEFWGT